MMRQLRPAEEEKGPVTSKPCMDIAALALHIAGAVDRGALGRGQPLVPASKSTLVGE